MRCGLTEEKIARQLELQMSHNFTLKQTVVVDYHRYVFSERNVTTIKLDIINVVNIVNSLYQALEIDIVLTGLEVWTTNNPINTSDDLDYVLDYFCTWKQNNLDGRLPYDVVHLFMKEYYGGGKLGVAYVGGACHNQHSNFAIAMSHELGHNLGMWHDERYCGCGSRTCTMNRYYTFSFRFSNCSYAEYWDNRRNTCIYPLAHESDVFKIKYCGNEVVDAGEECDCGSVQQCARNPCCQSNCTFSPGSSCSFGLCCKDCKFRPPGTLCRHPLNKCDLPEWCNGTSHQCPDDVYVQDGSPCSDNAYCYKKTCNTHDLQCKEIFGRDARSASQSCYNKINTQGNRFGHCDIVGTTYTKCSEPDIMCGRVQCENVSRLPFLQSHFTVHQLHFNQNTCWGTDYHLGMSIPDIGQVKEGTSCAPGKICISKKCASKAALVSHVTQGEWHRVIAQIIPRLTKFHKSPLAL
uniref:ADAM metallopeptidase domain 20 n=1 Tax=Marmota marmota marmota TaxID=9994 RepID=A0A8C5ZMK5_MARMA